MPVSAPSSPIPKKKKVSDDPEIPFLEFPDDILINIFSFFDYETRVEMRKLKNERLMDIEMKARYRYRYMIIDLQREGLCLSVDGFELALPLTEVEEEFELLGKTTRFDEIEYKMWPEDHVMRAVVVNATRYIKANMIEIDDVDLEDSEFRAIAQDKEEVVILCQTQIGLDGIMWVYENMRNRRLNLTKVKMSSSECSELVNFMNILGTFGYEFSTKIPNMKVTIRSDRVIITEGHLKIIIKGLTDEDEEEESDNAKDSDDEEVDDEVGGCIFFKRIEASEENDV